jgi:hypothetical protein
MESGMRKRRSRRTKELSIEREGRERRKLEDRTNKSLRGLESEKEEKGKKK